MIIKKNIPFFPYQAFFGSRDKEFTEVLQDVLRRGAFILQKDLEEFEKNLARYLGVKHALGVANCTDGLVIALKVAGIQPGDEVILPSHTFIATASAIHLAGGVAVPVECAEDHLLDPESVELAVTSRTRFLMPVQLNGRTCRMDRLQKIADRNGLQIVEDAAQGLGSSYKGRYAGTFGVVSAFSFYPAKILGCFGDGGAVVTNDDRLAEIIYAMRDHGRNREGRVICWGTNSRLDNVQAAILNYQFQYYAETVRCRREVASLYTNCLKNISELLLPPAPDSDPDHFDTFQNYEIEAERRDELRAYLKEVGVGTLVQWGGTAVHQFRELGFKQNLPKTDRLFTRCLMLPMNTYLTNEEVTYICDRILEFYSHRR
ncbi:MAG: DegT/DnrJ/EryC1/StrS family aminotransferase [Deltaproteobacteria bacterium]|nr:DegT/DnrJ/EryC1/StrS family aminotransferase [Deltaproteobacteria bacterium]